jgi:GalNAc-alpha-(1->4)-GalNAc-alpha-(1->3)-diNAcBac-PP-undecaprenol alpha-1,4-N-acetyl-D-galactosaminyltransferase
MTDKFKIFFVAPCLSMGGMERAAVNTANGLRQHGTEVVFLSLFKKPHFFALNSDITLLEPNNFNVNSLNLIKSVLWIRSEIKKHKPTQVLVFNKLYGAITAFALFRLNYPLYISERSSPLFKWKFPLNWINRIAYTLYPPKGVIAQTSIAASRQKNYFKKSKVTVVPNSVREVKLYPEIQREKIILAVGRLNDYLKGFDLLLQTISLLKNKDWEVHVAGGDGEGHELEKLSFDLGISNRVRFLGKIKDIDPLYAKAGLFVIPSRSEGFPNALAEAMAAGCCCISFDFTAGPRDLIIDKENGYIVTNGSIQELADAIDELILDSGRREYLGKNAMKVREKLKISFIVEKITSFIHDNN